MPPIARQNFVCEREGYRRSGPAGNQEVGNIGAEMFFESFIPIRQCEL